MMRRAYMYDIKISDLNKGIIISEEKEETN